jgi:5-methylcytosine-specific restriction endonuclease McrA
MAYEFESFHRNIPDEELLDDLRRTALASERESMTTREYDATGKFRSTTIMARFGGWAEACAKAGLLLRHSPKNPSEEDLFRNIEEVWIKLGRQPRYREIRKPLSKFTMSPYKTRYQTWENALAAFVTYINDEETAQSENAITEWKVEPTTKHKTSRTINLRLRFIVMRRDNFKCKSCGRSPATDPTVILHVDHITAWTKNGETVLENLQTLCSICNIGKSDLEFLNSSPTEVQNV